MKFILLNWVKYYTKEVGKALKVTSTGAMIILTIVFIKYKPVYQVNLAGTSLGYIENKDKIELKIKNYLEDTTGNVAFKEQVTKPEYEFKLVNRDKQIQEKEVLMAIEDSTIVTYRTYAITVDGTMQAVVSSQEEAKSIIENMKADVSPEIGLNVGIVEQYSNDLNIQTRRRSNRNLK